MAKITAQDIRQYVGRGFKGKLTADKKKRIELSILRAVNEYLFDRSANGKDWDNKSITKKYSKQYESFKRKYLSGELRGRGGRPSKTLKRLKQREARHRSVYKATTVNDKLRLTGLLLSRIKVEDVKLIQARGSERFVVEFKVGVGNKNIGDDKQLNKQVEGLFDNGYKFVGFKSRQLPPDLLRTIKANIERILND